MSQFSIWAKLCAGKTLLAHPFKLKVLAVFCVRNGEVMVIPTTIKEKVPGKRYGVALSHWVEVRKDY